LFKVLSIGMNTCPQPWPPLINGLVDDALLELSQKQLLFCKVVWRRYLGEVGKFYRALCFVANLSKTLRINFYQNRSSIVEVTIKNFGVFFYASQCLLYYYFRFVFNQPTSWS